MKWSLVWSCLLAIKSSYRLSARRKDGNTLQTGEVIIRIFFLRNKNNINYAINLETQIKEASKCEYILITQHRPISPTIREIHQNTLARPKPPQPRLGSCSGSGSGFGPGPVPGEAANWRRRHSKNTPLIGVDTNLWSSELNTGISICPVYVQVVRCS